MNDSSIERRAAFDFVRYANCWEDADVLCRALRPQPGRRMLSIASGGDNALALAAHGAEVVAADLNPAQIALVELKMEAIRHLDHPELLRFLGLEADTQRLETYRALSTALSPAARDYWDRQAAAIQGGVVHMGKFEGYFRFFRRRVLPLVHPRRRVERLLAAKSAEDRLSFYREQWDNRRWRFMFRLFFSRTVMGRLGRDPEFFRYVQGAVADRILERTRYALTHLATDTNPYLRYILTGAFRDALPPYLDPTRFEALRDGVGRVTLYCGGIGEATRETGSSRFDGFNLSDIFEYLDENACADLYGRLLDAAQPGARLVYWNMLVPRAGPACHADRVSPLEEEAAALFSEDRAFFYSALKVDEVR